MGGARRQPGVPRTPDKVRPAGAASFRPICITHRLVEMAYLTSVPPSPSLSPVLPAGEPALNAILLWSALFVLVLGVLLLKLGWLPRRRGDEPRCRRCGYDLTANASGRCPECGADVSTPRGVARGMGRRRPVVGLAGLLLMFFATFVALPDVRARVGAVDWYSYKPLGMVITDLRSPRPARQLQALAELDRREQAGNLPASAQADVADALLDAVDASLADVPEEFLYALTSRIESDGLTEAQRLRFFRSVCKYELKARPNVVRGEAIPWRVAGPARKRELYPDGDWSFVISSDDAPLDEGELSSSRSTSGQSPLDLDMIDVAAAPPPLGGHVLRMTVDVEATLGERVLYQETLRLTAPVTVVASEEEAAIRELRDPELDRLIRSRLKFFTRNSLGIWLGGAPTNVACDVLVRVDPDGPAEPWGTLLLAKGEHGYCKEGPGPFRAVRPPDGTVDVILRSSQAVARRTPDFEEIWAGEIVIEDVRVDSP